MTNDFKVFDENQTNIMSDDEYALHTQRANGVQAGVASSQLHNKLYLQASIMVKAMADFIVSQGFDATDKDAASLAQNLQAALSKFAVQPVTNHRTAPVLDHPAKSVTEAKLADESVSTRTIAPKSVTGEKMSDSGVSPGNYTKVTVDRTGRVTAGGSPATLAEAGIKDAYTKAEADQHFVNADGDTMTGPLNLKNARLSCETTNSAGSSIKNDLIRIGTANQYGINVGFGGNGNTIVGSGESVQAMLDWLIGKANEFHEEMYTTADGDCILLSNCQSGIASAKELRFKANGELWVNGAKAALTDHTYDLSTNVAHGLLRKLTGNISHFLRGDGAWAIPPNTNNISAASLGTNGYIKFNNGLIIQWGYSSSTNSVTNITFPTAFGSAFTVLVSAKTNKTSQGNTGSQNNPTWCNLGTTGFRFCIYDSGNGFAGFSWLAVGKA